MRTELDFVRTTRDKVISALLGERPISAGLLDAIERRDEAWVELVYVSEDSGSLPVALIVPDSMRSDFFIWLETYAAQFSPITSHCRVFSSLMARDILLAGCERVRDVRRAKMFAGLVVGEVVAQSLADPMRALTSAAVLHAHSTYSFAISRLCLLRKGQYRFGGIEKTLAEIESAGLLGGRRVPAAVVGDIVSVITGGRAYAENEDFFLVQTALEELSHSEVLSKDTLLKISRRYEPARELLAAASMSAEERVKAFDRLLGYDPGSLGSPLSLFCVAYAAIGIGGGTTRHMGLLVDVGELHPSVWLWFGVIGSVGSDSKWHPLFSRLARLVMRELMYSFDPCDPPRSDVQWEEARACGSHGMQQWLTSIPKANSKLVMVEVEHGVSLAVSLGLGKVDARPENRPDESYRVTTSELDDVLEKLWALRQRVAGAFPDEETQKKSSPRRAKSRRVSEPKGGKLL